MFPSPWHREHAGADARGKNRILPGILHPRAGTRRIRVRAAENTLFEGPPVESVLSRQKEPDSGGLRQKKHYAPPTSNDGNLTFFPVLAALAVRLQQAYILLGLVIFVPL